MGRPRKTLRPVIRSEGLNAAAEQSGVKPGGAVVGHRDRVSGDLAALENALNKVLVEYSTHSAPIHSWMGQGWLHTQANAVIRNHTSDGVGGTAGVTPPPI
jgi:hypothetical protein